MTPLLCQLQALEVELHHPGVRLSRERLAQLLHPQFHEVGRSGRAYTRETVISYLSVQESQPEVVSKNFAMSELGPEVVLLTYRSAHNVPTEGLTNHTLRTSIWLKVAASWQLRYHQGTAFEQQWCTHHCVQKHSAALTSAA